MKAIGTTVREPCLAGAVAAGVSAAGGGADHRRHHGGARILVDAIFALAAVLSWAALASAASTPITTCGAAVSGSAHLPADLDCSAYAGDAITLLGGSLDLQGHTLTGGTGYAVRCNDNCGIKSDPPNGTITGATLSGVYVGDVTDQDAMTLVVEDVIITGNTEDGIYDDLLATTLVKRSTVTANGRHGLQGRGRKASIFDSSFTANAGTGIGHTSSSTALLVKNCTVNGNAFEGISGTKVRVFDSDILNNGTAGMYDGVIGAIRFVRSHSEGNSGHGMTTYAGLARTILDSTIKTNLGGGVGGTGTARVKRSDVSNNGGDGITGFTIVLTDATVNGNDGYAGRAGKTVRMRRSTMTGNDSGVYIEASNVSSAKATITDSTIALNRFNGVVAVDYLSLSFNRRAVIQTRRSNVNGNGTDPSCNLSPVVCADLATDFVPPNFDFVPGTYECDTSYRGGTAYQPCPDCPPGLFPGIMYGVCAQDCNNGAPNGVEVCDTGGESAACDDNCTPATCGDMKVNAAAGETCDDGNVSNMDACKNDCTPNVCGDGFVRTGFEGCDDGNLTNGDGCSSTCQVE